MKIHFVCTANLFRSRLCEAYLESKNIPNLDVSSSGTRADNEKGTVSWITQRLALRHGLMPFIKPNWDKTTAQNISSADLVIFIGENNYKFCQENFSKPRKFEVWEIDDFQDRDVDGKPLDLEKESEFIYRSENVFKDITKKVDNLVKEQSL